MRERPSLRARLLLVIGATLAALLIAEGGLRLSGVAVSMNPMLSDPVLHHVHPPRGVFRVTDEATEFGGHVMEYDEQGRVRAMGSPCLAPSTRIALMGDSFVEAVQVPIPQSFFGRLAAAAKPGVCVENYGVAQYSPALYYLQFQKVVSPAHPALVLLFLCSNDVTEDAEYMAAARLGADGLPVAVPGPGTMARSLLRHSYLARLGSFAIKRLFWIAEHGTDRTALVDDVVEENPDIGANTARLLLGLEREVRATGAVFMLTAVPSKAAYNGTQGEMFDSRAERWAHEHGIPFVSLAPAFREAAARGVPAFFKRDIHFTVEGHRLVFDVLRRRFPQYFD